LKQHHKMVRLESLEIIESPLFKIFPATVAFYCKKKYVIK